MTEPTPPAADTVVVNRPPVFVKLFHGSGLQVSVPLGVGLDPAQVYADLDNWLATGWKPEPPGIEPGEQKEEIAYVVRKFTSNDRGDSNRLDLYAESLKWAVLTVYLDNDDQIAEFERAANVKLRDLPIYEGDNKIERGKNANVDRKYVVRLPRTVIAVSKPNPRYNAEEAAKATQSNPYTKPKKVFVRWGNQNPSPPAIAPQAQSQGPQPAVVDQDAIDNWSHFILVRPTAVEMTSKLRDSADFSNATKKAIFAIAMDYASNQGYRWDAEDKKWVDPTVDGDEIPF